MSSTVTLRTGSAMPWVVLSADVLSRTAQAAVVAGGTTADLRADGYGHGAVEVARVLAEAGVQAAAVDVALRDDVVAAGLKAAPADAVDIDPYALYGLPAPAGTAPEVHTPRTPVMSLRGTVMSTKPIAAGGGVSYGYTHRASVDSHLALVTGGYAQGVVRSLGNVASVEICGRLHPIVGRVAMDVCVVDIGDADVRASDDVIFFGGTGPAAHALDGWARSTGMDADGIVAVCGSLLRHVWEVRP